MPLRETIDELDVLIGELSELRQTLRRAELAGAVDDVLWDAEANLRHVSRRTADRARLLRRAIELNTRAEGRQARQDPPRSA